MLTEALMRTMWPHADASAPGRIAGFMQTGDAVLTRYGITSDLLVAHAMAQFTEECGAGTDLVESLNYSAAGLMKTWPSRFDAARAAAFEHRERAIANEVYNGRLGNEPGSDDGWTFRGRGASQLTGRANYAALGKLIGLDLVDNPDLVLQPQNFLLCGVADFIMCGCLPFAAADDVKGVTYHLNGGYNGLDARIAALANWKAALGIAGADAHGTLWLQQSLNALGTEPPLIPDGAYGPLTVAAVKAFQLSHNLEPDGKLGPNTLAAIEAALGGP
ncbi:MAG: peptidoglycan-binding protein [Rhodospirillales bacterium]